MAVWSWRPKVFLGLDDGFCGGRRVLLINSLLRRIRKCLIRSPLRRRRSAVDGAFGQRGSVPASLDRSSYLVRQRA